MNLGYDDDAKTSNKSHKIGVSGIGNAKSIASKTHRKTWPLAVLRTTKENGKAYGVGKQRRRMGINVQRTRRKATKENGKASYTVLACVVYHFYIMMCCLGLQD